jgi:hypothetical protein
VQGATGAGAQGAQGSQGNVGVQGAQGVQGASGAQGASGDGVSGGVTNNVAKFAGATTLGNSILFDNNTSIGIGTTSPAATLDVSGNAKFTSVDSTRVNPRVVSTSNTATLTPDISVADQYNITALSAALTINAPIGTPVDGNKLMIRLLDNGTTRSLTWNATYTVVGTTLPTSTTAGKISYIGCAYNSANTRWDVIATATQA